MENRQDITRDSRPSVTMEVIYADTNLSKYDMSKICELNTN